MRLRERIKRPKFYIKGIATYMPDSIAKFMWQHQAQFRGKGIRQYAGSHETAMACYTSWMRTLVTIHEQGIATDFKGVAEIGPGDSLGVGFAALLSGADTFLALDVASTAYNFDNEKIFEDIVGFFKNRSPFWNKEESPKHRPYLDSYEFPKHILTDDKLEKYLDESRLDKIRAALRSHGKSTGESGEISISYSVPWDSDELLSLHKESVDLVISTAALEHVDDVPRTYYGINEILRDGGIIASAIDFKSHGSAGLRNGHFAYSDFEWKIIRGDSIFFINRWPHAWHINEMKKYFDIVHDEVFSGKNFLEQKDLAPQFAELPESELGVAEAFIIGRKRHHKNK